MDGGIILMSGGLSMHNCSCYIMSIAYGFPKLMQRQAPEYLFSGVLLKISMAAVIAFSWYFRAHSLPLENTRRCMTSQDMAILRDIYSERVVELSKITRSFKSHDRLLSCSVIFQQRNF